MGTIAESPKLQQIAPIYLNWSSMPEIKMVEHELYSHTDLLSSPIKEMCIHIITSAGKRLRPFLLISSAKCFGRCTQKVIKAAAAAEFIHLASLVHDDIIDNSHLRHKKITLNSMYGNHISVLVGDFLFAKAFEIMCSNRIDTEMEVMVDAIQNMCEGEIMQSHEIELPSMAAENYYKRIEKKTAKLLASCCSAGASMTTSDTELIKSLEYYGLNLGYAFQIVDDILDVNGDPNKIGKPVFSDISQGNLTLPILLLIEHNEYAGYINEVMEEKTITPEIQLIIREGLHKTGALHQAYLKASEYCNTAKSCLNIVPDNQSRQLLLSVPDVLLARCN